jgi:hypothetical protein
MTRALHAAALLLILTASAVPAAPPPPGGAPISAADAPPTAAAPSALKKEGPPGPAPQPAVAIEAAPAKETPAAPGAKRPLLLKSVGIGEGRQGREQVVFTFDRPYRPDLKTLPGERPRIYFDVPGATVDPAVPAHQDGRGPLIRQVRMSVDSTAGSLRVAVELVPDKDYVVRPVLYRKGNRFLLEIEPKPSRPRIRP